MTIEFISPFTKAWNRMKTALFSPFDLQKWGIIGFNAFLAGLLDGNGAGGGSRAGDGGGSLREFLDFPSTAWNWLINHPWLFAAILLAMIVGVVIFLVLLWLSSRGKFLFLDNVVQGRAEVKNPWKEFSREGDSLFFWRLGFAIIVFLIFILFLFFIFITLSALYESGKEGLSLPFVLITGLVFLFSMLLIAYAAFFLDGFVVPIMYKHRLKSTKAWSRFLSLFRKHPFHFLWFGILVFVIMVIFIAVVVLAGLLTCCVGWIILIIPYIGTVATLPVWYTLRAFSVDFLAQFGEDYQLFPSEETHKLENA